MSGIGVEIHDVEVHTCTECDVDPAFQALLEDNATSIEGGRVIRLRLGEARAAAICHVLCALTKLPMACVLELLLARVLVRGLRWLRAARTA
jgi:hypothetical protein